MNARRIAAVTAVVIALAAGMAVAEEVERTQLLIYMIGSDLESQTGCATMDLQEMMEAFPVDGKLEVLICAGGAQRWHRLIDPEIPTLYRLTSVGVEKIEEYPYGSMTDGETLEWFLSQKEGAEKTALVFWNHGGGPLVGFGYDEMDQKDHLQMEEIAHALQKCLREEEKLAWIGFDACLMGTLETAGLLEPYADYLVASEEVEMNCGWDYGFLSQMTKGLSTPRLANRIVSDFFESTVKACGGDPQMMPTITLACYDLSRYPRLADRFDELARQMDASIAFGSFAALAHSRSTVPSMGRFSVGLNTELVDLRRLVQSVQVYYPEEAQAVLDALDEMIVACATNNPDNSGIAVYFPYSDKEEYLSGMDAVYESLMPVEGYRAFVDRFAQQWVDGMLDQTSLISETESGKPSIMLSDELLGNFSSAHYVIAQDYGSDGYGFYYMGSETELVGNILSADYPMETAYVVTRAERFPIFLRKQEENESRILYHANVFVVKKTEEMGAEERRSAELQIVMNKKTRQCTVIGAYLEDERTRLGKRQLDLSEWDVLQVVCQGYQPTRNQQGVLLPYTRWYCTGSVFGVEIALEEAFCIEMMPIAEPEGDLHCQFVIEDVYGNHHGSELVLLQQGKARQEQSSEYLKSLSWHDVDRPLTLVDTERLCVELKDVNRSTGSFFTMEVLNKEEQPRYLSMDYLAINGVMITAPGMVRLPPNERIQWKVDVTSYPFECAETDVFTSMQMILVERDERLSALDTPLNLKISLDWPFLMKRRLDDRAAIRMCSTPLWNDGEISIAATNVAVRRTEYQMAELYFVLQNQTDALVQFDSGCGYLNEWMLEDSITSVVLLPGTRAFAAVRVGADEFLPAADGNNRLGVIWEWKEPSKYATSVRSTGLQEVAVEQDVPTCYAVAHNSSPWAEVTAMDFCKPLGSETMECILTIRNISDRHLVLSSNQLEINGRPTQCEIRAVVMPDKSVRVSCAVNAEEETLKTKGAMIGCTLEVYDIQQQMFLGQLQLECTVK